MVKPRPAHKTVKFIDQYCEIYRDLFPEVRTFEYFKYLHLGLISDIKRKSLPAIAKVLGLENAEGLNHFLTESPWSVEELKNRRLELILQVINEEEIIVIIDEKGDQYKSKPKIGGEIIKKLKEKGFKIKLVLADSEYGESEDNFVSIFNKEELNFVLAIRSNHGMWLPSGQRVRANKWREFERIFSTQKREKRYVREIIYGKKREIG